ncbi:hypothetical protein LTR22_027677 [Elasticomyces elasticus]|nr:hypothetical protein LTR22_027677 [Elasticomyces elasticus]
MRLLQCNEDGGFRLTEDLAEDDLPPYAILSHRWLAASEEPTFEDLSNNCAQEKLGYQKLRFCAEQGRSDGLQHFWVDTCCIDKVNKAELSRSINSMFRWYHNATTCYVYLSDVTSQAFDSAQRNNLQASAWFSRGWTLQELLAPHLVVFYSGDGERLGDKRSLEQHIHEITAIPQAALQGKPLHRFSVDERLAWMTARETTLEEDKAYSMAGMFNMYLAPVYGEGFAQAHKRLLKLVHKRDDCVRDLRLSNPYDDKKRIEHTKGGLLVDAYDWILEHPQYVRWRDSGQRRMLWIRGDPGKGKTMLLCGIINELKNQLAERDGLSYFFCQANDARINNATAVLRGLILLLVDQQPSLTSHIQEEYDRSSKNLFEDGNAWFALSDIFTRMLQDSSFRRVYLIVDALDECVEGGDRLLDLIGQTTLISTKVKWLVSSRNWPSIREQIASVNDHDEVSLELNANAVSRAVQVFIKQRVLQLSAQKRYSKDLQSIVLRHLYTNANDTFLWVALSCQYLSKVLVWDTVSKLKRLPPGLDDLYVQMWKNICSSDNEDLCKSLLSTTTVLYRPASLAELTCITESLTDASHDPAAIISMIELCGSFLTVREDHVYFVHESAREFLSQTVSSELYPFGKGRVHYDIFSRSLQHLSMTLKRDIYSLSAPDVNIEDVKRPDPDPLARSRYSTVYWIAHLCACYFGLSKDPGSDSHYHLHSVHDFLQSKCLYWLEALSLCRGMSDGVILIGKLKDLIEATSSLSALSELVQDALRFTMYHKQMIETHPLQVYISALLFTPQQSIIGRRFRHDAPKWVTVKPAVDEDWSACIQTLEGHSGGVRSVVFSADSSRLASASNDKTVKIWDASSGQCLRTLEGHSGAVISVVFSADSSRLASASWDKTVKIWDASSGQCLRTLEGHSDGVSSVVFSADSSRLASASRDMTVKIWDASSGQCLRTLEGHSNAVISVVFSADSSRLTSASLNKTVKIWDASSGQCLRTLEGHSAGVSSVVFSADSSRLASALRHKTVKIWDASSGQCLRTLEGHSDMVISVAFSADSSRLASASRDKTVRIWDASTGQCLRTLEGHSHEVSSVVFFTDSSRLASASYDKTVRIWDASSRQCLRTLEDHSHEVISVVFSADSSRLASGSRDKTVKIWDASSGQCLRTLEGHSNLVISVVFSADSSRLASASFDKTVKVWDASSGQCLRTLEGHSNGVSSVVFSADSSRLASGSRDKTVKIWDASSGQCLRTLEGHSDIVSSVAFSTDSSRLASASWDKTVRIWDASSGQCLRTLKGHSNWVISVVFSADSSRLASGSGDKTVKIWDASNGQCLQTFEVGRALYRMSFNVTESSLDTDIGSLPLDASSSPRSLSLIEDTRCIKGLGPGISADGLWIKYDSSKVVWLPSERRPSCSDTTAQTVGIGVGNGRVWMCSFIEQDVPKPQSVLEA